jgi:enoyl-CoA hydratase/carnithine racemase
MDAVTHETIRCEIDDGILTITLARAAQMNAFTVTMAEELIEAFDAASANDGVRAIIVTGEGRAFCAGMDLSSQDGANVFGLNQSMRPTMRDLDERFDDPDIVHGVRDTGGRVALAIFNCTKPVIAAINGAAVGVGATLPLAMDIRIASDRARFGFVFGKIGIVPDACSSWFLPRIVGLPKALQWTFSAELVAAQDALASGLVSQVVTPEQLLPEARRLAHLVSDKRSPVSVALIRQMMYRNSAATDPLQAHKVESLGVFYTSLADGKEGVAAFLGKRDPQFTQRASDMPDFYPWWT